MSGVRPFGVLVLAALLAAALAPGAWAVTAVSPGSGIAETVTIPGGGFHAYSVALSDADVLRLEVRSTAGFLLDVYVLNSTNFLAYVRGSSAFAWIEGPSRENVLALRTDFRPALDGNYYVVLDNGMASPSGAVPVGDVGVAVEIGPALPVVEPSWLAVAVVAGLGAAFVAILVATYLRPGWHERPWVRRSWTGPRPGPRSPPTPPSEYNEFRDSPPRA